MGLRGIVPRSVSCWSFLVLDHAVTRWCSERDGSARPLELDHAVTGSTRGNAPSCAQRWSLSIRCPLQLPLPLRSLPRSPSCVHGDLSLCPLATALAPPLRSLPRSPSRGHCRSPLPHRWPLPLPLPPIARSHHPHRHPRRVPAAAASAPEATMLGASSSRGSR